MALDDEKHDEGNNEHHFVHIVGTAWLSVEQASIAKWDFRRVGDEDRCECVSRLPASGWTNRGELRNQFRAFGLHDRRREESSSMRTRCP